MNGILSDLRRHCSFACDATAHAMLAGAHHVVRPAMDNDGVMNAAAVLQQQQQQEQWNQLSTALLLAPSSLC